MNSSEFSRITDELLSAYIDNAVTAQERILVDVASAADAEIAWRLDSLRQTVALLHDLPDMPLPRSFVLRESQVMEAALPSGSAGPAEVSMSLLDRLAAGWRQFWRPGNPVLRNAAAAAFVALLVLVAGDTLLGDWRGGTSMMAPAAYEAAAPAQFAEAAPASAALAPDAESTEEAAGDVAADAGAEPAIASGVADAGSAAAESVTESFAVEPSALTAPPQPASKEAEAAPAEAATVMEPQAASLAEAAPAVPFAAAPFAAEAAEAAGEPSAPAAMALPGEPGPGASPEMEAAEEAMVFRELGIVGGEDGRGNGSPTARQAGAQEAPAAMMAQTAVTTLESATVEEEAPADVASAAEAPALIAKAAAEPEQRGETAPAAEQPAPEATPFEATVAEATVAEPAKEAAVPVATATPLPANALVVAPAAQSPLQEPYPGPLGQLSVGLDLRALVQWVQLGLALVIFVLGVMWWRSRSTGVPPGGE